MTTTNVILRNEKNISTLQLKNLPYLKLCLRIAKIRFQNKTIRDLWS